MTQTAAGPQTFISLTEPPSLDRAFIFPGQGSQVVGMGRDLYENHAAARELYDAADEILGFPLSRLCFEGPEEELQRTENTQPAIAVTSLALLRVATETTPGLLARPAYVAGHSLGEYPALIAAGAIGFADAITLLRLRGQLMQAAGDANPGAMAAIMGLAVDLTEAACHGAGAEVCTDNAPGQIVIGGRIEAVTKAMADATERGAVRVVQLAVSGAFHSSLMRSASEALRAPIDATAIKDPTVPVVANCTATPIGDAGAIRKELVEQVCSTVRWRGTIEFLLAQGVTTFVEFGPGKVLTSIVKRMQPSARTFTINSLAAADVAL